MLFSKRTQTKPQRGMTPGSRRQLIACTVLLGLLCLLSYRLSIVGRQAKSPPGQAADSRTEARAFGTVIEEAAPTPPAAAEAGDFGAPPGPHPPEPWVERPEVLALAAKRDKTIEIEERALAYLLQRVRAEGDELSRKPPALSLDRGDPVFQELYEHPEKYRGMLVEVKGNITSAGRGLPLRLRGLEAPNPSGLDRAFESYLLGVDGKYYLVATARKRAELEHMEGVRLRAYFCQLYTGQAIYKGEVVAATIPFLVGDDYEVLRRPVARSPSMVYLPAAAAIAAAAVIAALFLRKLSRARYEARRSAAKVRKGGAGSEGPAS